VIRRILSRAVFALFAAALLHLMTLVPAASVEPRLSTALTLPLSRAATPAMEALAAAAADSPAPAVAEPDEPIPAEPEPEPGDIFALMYHDLTEDTANTSTWRTTPEAMRGDLAELAAMGYVPLSLEDYVSGEYEIGPDYYIVTFDDGYTSNASLAEPLLRELGVPAALFVITGSTELDNHLSWEELAELQSRGVISVYTHTHTHADAMSMSAAKFIGDVETSWDAILANLAEPAHKILSYPNGSYTRATMRALAADGFELFVIQNKPGWYEAGQTVDEEGIRILIRMNIAYEADMEELVNLNRERSGFGTVEEKLEAIRLAEEAAIAAERAARRAWMERISR